MKVKKTVIFVKKMKMNMLNLNAKTKNVKFGTTIIIQGHKEVLHIEYVIKSIVHLKKCL